MTAVDGFVGSGKLGIFTVGIANVDCQAKPNKMLPVLFSRREKTNLFYSALPGLDARHSIPV